MSKKRNLSLLDVDPCDGCDNAPGWFDAIWPLVLSFVLGGGLSFHLFGG